MNELNNKKSNEIDVVAIIQTLFKNWKTIFVFVSAFAVIGVVSALISTKRYTAETVLAPEVAQSDMSGLMGQLSSFMGKSVSSGTSDAISPELYPNLLKSTPFLINLFDVSVILQDSSDTLRYYDHLMCEKKNSNSSSKNWFAKILKSSQEENDENKELNPFFLTKEQSFVCDLMRKNIQCVVDQRTDLITVSVTDVDKVVAANIVDTVASRLKDYVIDYRTKKVRRDLEFTTEMCSQAKAEYLKVQAEYAKFVDANMNVVRESQKVQLENLKNEMQLKLNLYSNMALQQQLLNQRLQEHTPVFMVIQPASVPLWSSSMSRKMIVILFGFLGGVVGSIWCLFLRDKFELYIKNIKKSK